MAGEKAARLAADELAKTLKGFLDVEGDGSSDDDPERNHGQADELISAYLRDHCPHGKRISALFDRMEKWYA